MDYDKFLTDIAANRYANPIRHLVRKFFNLFKSRMSELTEKSSMNGSSGANPTKQFSFVTASFFRFFLL